MCNVRTGMSTKKNSGASRSETLPPLTQSLRKQSLLSHQTQEGDRTSISPSPVDNGHGEVKYSIDTVIAGKEVEELRITEETLKKVLAFDHIAVVLMVTTLL